jgi:hypothetical protein
VARVSLSGQEQPIEFIWSWYDDQKEALLDFRTKIFATVTTSSIGVSSKFIGLTTDELNAYFESSEEELEHLVCFDLISATEAVLRSDFFTKVYNKDKSDIGRIFRDIEKQKGKKVSLEDDIIENWKETVTARKTDFSNFLGLLNYRHWLAHGRYWTPKLGQQYAPAITYDISENIFDIVNKK